MEDCVYKGSGKRPDFDLLVGYYNYTLDEKYRILMFIWPTFKGMQKFTDTKKDTLAYFCYPEIIVHEGEIVEGDVAYFHFVEDEFGAGIFAHELQHFIQIWIEINELWPLVVDQEKDNWENIAYLAGDITTAFWKSFLRNEKENRNGVSRVLGSLRDRLFDNRVFRS